MFREFINIYSWVFSNYLFKFNMKQWNCRDLLGKLQKFLNLMLNYDVCCIQETWLNESHKVHFKNYSCFRSNRSSSHCGGGTLIVCKDCLDPIYYLGSPNNYKGCEFILISIKIPHSESDRILLVVTRPKISFKTLIKLTKEDLAMWPE